MEHLRGSWNNNSQVAVESKLNAFREEGTEMCRMDTGYLFYDCGKRNWESKHSTQGISNKGEPSNRQMSYMDGGIDSRKN